MSELSDAELVELIDKAVMAYNGNIKELKGAIGTLMIARKLGWKPLLLMQDKRSVAKYERILGVSFRELVPEVGPKARKSIAWVSAEKISNFWKAVKGETPGVRSPDMTEG